MSSWLRCLALLLALLVVAPAPPCEAQDKAPSGEASVDREAKEEGTKDKEEPSDEPLDPELQKKLGSPQATMQTFLEAVNNNKLAEAAHCLDFSEYVATEEVRDTKDKELAYKLKAILDKLVRIERDKFTTDPEHVEPISLLSTGHDIGVEDQPAAEKIVLARSDDGLWRFSPETVAAIEELYESYQGRETVSELTIASRAEVPFSIWLSERFPVRMRKTRFLIPDYQWICLLVVAILGIVADRLTRIVLSVATSLWFRFRADTEPPIVRGMWRPMGLLMQGVTWYFATKWIGLPPLVLTVLLIGLKFFAVIAAVWTAFHLIDLLSRVALRRTSRTGTRFDDLLVPLMSKSLKIVAACIGLVICADAFGWEITGVLGGLGIGGIALAFAAQDAISNLFGSVTVLLDRPFEVGDWIAADGVEGTVEAVGFRSTRVRTFYNSLITLPNSRLTTAAVDNLGRRRYRRFKTTLGVQYDTTAGQMEAFCAGVREIIRRHPYTRKDYYHVYFNDLGSSSLEILLYCFFECPDWPIELRERHRLLVDIMKLAQRLEVHFAFPTRTIHMLQGEPAGKPSWDGSSDPLYAGQEAAAEIAGAPISPEDRPGPVDFS